MTAFHWHPESDAERIQRALLSPPVPPRIDGYAWASLVGAVAIAVGLAFGWLT